MSKNYIIEKIKELAAGGDSPGLQKFSKATGIKESEINKYWENWGQALQEAGYQPNDFGQAIPEDFIIEKIIELIREKQEFPNQRLFIVKKNQDTNFPSQRTIRDRLGDKAGQLKAIIAYCNGKEDYTDVLSICQKVEVKTPKIEFSGKRDLAIGYVYLIKFGDFFKIGRSNDFDRRLSEIKTKLPEEGELIHVIETDDPEGIEAYWHNRFKDRRARGEWFKLSNDDVKVLRKRKFM